MLFNLVLAHALAALLVWHFFKPQFANLLERFIFAEPGYDVPIEPPVSPAPRSNPLLSVEEALSLRQLFEERDFAALKRRLEALQKDFEADQNHEHLIVGAFAIFALDRQDYEPLLDGWVAELPEHFAPYLARAHYWSARGWQSRGDKRERESPQAKFRAMRQHFERALGDLERTLAINPRLLPAYRVLIGIHAAQGDDYLLAETFATARRLFPACYRLYSIMLWAREPRWGAVSRRWRRSP